MERVRPWAEVFAVVEPHYPKGERGRPSVGLEQHGLTKKLFDVVNVTLGAAGLMMREGTIVDATIIAAPPSVKNKANARDPDMHQTKKGNQWYFGKGPHWR